jgi:hypothetical protein
MTEAELEGAITQIRENSYKAIGEILAPYTVETANPQDPSTTIKAAPHFILLAFIPIPGDAPEDLREAVSLTSSLPSQLIPVTLMQFLTRIQQEGNQFQTFEIPQQ